MPSYSFIQTNKINTIAHDQTVLEYQIHCLIDTPKDK